MRRLRFALAALALAWPTVASSQTPEADSLHAKTRPNGSLFSDAYRSEEALSSKAAVIFATVAKVPRYDPSKHSKGGDEPRLTLRVGGSYIGDYEKGRNASVSVEWRQVYWDVPDGVGGDLPPPKRAPRAKSGASHVPVVCGREVVRGMTLLLGLDVADDASGPCSILALESAPADEAAALRTWDEHHGFAYIYRNADAVASCEGRLVGRDALAAADLVAYAELDDFVQTQGKSYVTATLQRVYKDERAKKTRKIKLLSYIEDSFPLIQNQRAVIFVDERDGELVATRCGGTEEVLVEPDSVAGEAGIGPSKITCDRLASEDASFHASSLVAFASVQDIIAASPRTQRLRMRPLTTFKDTRPIPGELFDLIVSPDEGVSFAEDERVLVFAEPMRNQFTVDPCGASRSLTHPPDEIAGVAGTRVDTFACAPEHIGSGLIRNTSIILAGQVTKSQTMTKQGLLDLEVSHVYAGAKHVPESRKIKVYYPVGDRPFTKDQRLLMFIERFDSDRLRSVSCGSTRVLSGEPPERLINLERVTLTVDEPLAALSSSGGSTRDEPASSCSTVSRDAPRPAPSLLFVLIACGACRRRRAR